MGWFSKRRSEAKAQGSEAGQLARELIYGEFALTQFYTEGKFFQPDGFFSDPYVVGFLHGYLVTMADVCSARRGKHWTQQEGTEFMLSAMEEIVGSEQMMAFVGEPRRCKDNEKYKESYFAANTLIKAIFATSSLTSENHLVKEANTLINERGNFLVEMFPEPRNGDFLAWAVTEISIRRHIQSVYLTHIPQVIR